MTYETIAPIAQMTAMVIFFVLFAGAVAYALWPGNKERFQRAAESPLVDDERLED